MPDLVPVDHDPFAPRLVPVDHDPWQQYIEPPAPGQRTPLPSDGPPSDAIVMMGRQPTTPDEARAALWGMTGVPDIQQGAQALGRGEYLPGFGQMATGVAQLGGLAAPVARGAMPLLREALGAVPGVMGDTTGAIRVFHGSPYDFEKFDSSKIGAGQGAQSFGHGLYFAEYEPVARGYRDTLSAPPEPLRFEYKGENVYDPLIRSTLPDDIYHGSMELHARSSWTKPEAMTPEYWDRMRNDLQNTIGNYEKAHGEGRTLLGGNLSDEQRSLNFARAALSAMNDPDFKIIPGKPSPGRMYEAQINADPEHFLDWDKPFSEQTPYVQKIANDLLAEGTEQGELYGRPTGFAADTPGQKIYDAMRQFGTRQDIFGQPSSFGGAEATELLRERGILGIRYLDQGSRGAGDGTHNYVVFDDKLIDIIRKYGLAGLIAGGAATIGGDQAGATHLIPVDHNPFEAQP